MDGAPDPAGAGNGADSYEEQDNCPAPKKHDSNQNNLEDSRSYQSKNKKSKESELEDNLTDQKKTIKGVEIDFDYEFDKNGNPILFVPMKDGGTRRIEFDQTHEKWYHEGIFPNISPPDGFDNQAVRDLDYSDRLDYLRKTIPDSSVIELQNEIGKSLSHPKTRSVPGFLGKYKIEGMIDINMQSGLVSFTDFCTNKHRIIVKMSRERIQELAKNDFHLFPNK